MDDTRHAPPHSSAGGPDHERALRLHVHVALASIVLTLFAPIVSWALWLNDRRAPSSRWKRRLLALAIVDTVLIIGLALSAAFGLDLDTATRERPRIGVVLVEEARDHDAEAEGDGSELTVERVVPESPAAAAGVERGDRIVSVDGDVVHGARELRTALEAGGERPRRLRLRRDARSLDVVLTPTTSELRDGRSSADLFEPLRIERERRSPRRVMLGAGVIDLAIVAGLAVAAKRRRARAAPGLAVMAGLIALTAVSSTVLVAFALTIGLSLGALLVSMLSGSAALLVVGVVAGRLAAPGPVQVGPAISTPKAIVLGVFYGIIGAVRVLIFATIVVALFDLPMQTASEAFGLDRSWGVLGIGLFLLASVVFAPVAEEVLFRGVLLPWLARWMRPAAALAWTTLVFALGHLYYGAGVLLIAHYGLVLGWARLRTGRLIAPIALHAILNGTTALALLAASESSSAS